MNNGGEAQHAPFCSEARGANRWPWVARVRAGEYAVRGAGG